MTRRILFALAALSVGVLIGLPIAQFAQTGPRAPSPEAGRAPTPTQATVETVQIGAERPDLVDPSEVPDVAAISSQSTRVAEDAEPSVVYIEVELGPAYGRGAIETGSGVIISPSGYVVTNAHLVATTDDAVVVLPSQRREYRAEVVGRDPTTDIAVLRMLEVGVDGDAPLPVAALGDSDAVRVGEWVIAIGSPFGLQNTVTMGVVSATGRGNLPLSDNDFAIQDFIQTDASINQGNSGGALVNLRGELVGVVTAIATDSRVSQGYGFAVPVNLARVVVEDLIRYGQVRRGYLGVEVYDVERADAREAGMPTVRGVRVAGVVGDGPAQRAGVRPGDILLEISDRPVDATNQFQSRVAMHRPGDIVDLRIWRDGAERALRAQLADPADPSLEDWFASPAPAPTPTPAPSDEPVARSEARDWGVRFRDLTRAERREYERGAYVESVQPGSAAELDGLPRGTVVIEIENRPVATAEEARLALARQARNDRAALLRVRRPDGRTAFYDLASPFVE